MSNIIVYAIGNCQTIALLSYLREFIKKENPISCVYVEYRENIGYSKQLCYDLKIPVIEYNHFDKHHELYLQACDYLFCQSLDPTIYKFHHEYLESKVKSDCEIITLPSIFLSHPKEILNKDELERTIEQRIDVLKTKEIEKQVTVSVSEFIRQNYRKTMLFNLNVHPNTILFTYICLRIKEMCPQLPFLKITKELVSKLERTRLSSGDSGICVSSEYNIDVLDEWFDK